MFSFRQGAILEARALPTSCCAIRSSSQLLRFSRYQRPLMHRIIRCQSNEQDDQSFLEERSSSEAEVGRDFWEVCVIDKIFSCKIAERVNERIRMKLKVKESVKFTGRAVGTARTIF